jgi:hypothetical protein
MTTHTVGITSFSQAALLGGFCFSVMEFRPFFPGRGDVSKSNTALYFTSGLLAF